MSIKVRHIKTGEILDVADWFLRNHSDKYEPVDKAPEELKHKALYICPKCSKEYKTEKTLNKHVEKCDG